MSASNNTDDEANTTSIVPSRSTEAGIASPNATLESSMVKTIAESDLSEIGVDLMDAVDELPIPIFSTLRKMYRGVRSVYNHYYTKKVLQYLCAFSDIPADVRRKQLEKMIAEPAESRRLRVVA